MRTQDNIKTHGEVVADWENQDPEFRAAWDRLAFARDVAVQVIGYRADHDMSQRDLAKFLGVTQPQVARIENATHEPAHETLARLASKLDMEFTINYAPAKRVPKHLTRSARAAASVRASGDVRVYTAASQRAAHS